MNILRVVQEVEVHSSKVVADCDHCVVDEWVEAIVDVSVVGSARTRLAGGIGASVGLDLVSMRQLLPREPLG